MRLVDPDTLDRVLPMGDAVAALEACFGADELPETPPRVHQEVPDGTLLLMPASGVQGVGVKLVTLNPANPDRGLPFIHGLYALFAPGTLEPSVVIDGGALTALRTAAVSGLATRFLARADARRLVIFGAGVQGNSHLDAMLEVRDIADVTVVSRSSEPAEALAERARRTGLEARVGGADAVATADIVCTCTTSEEPLFDGDLLPTGCHINAVGTYRSHTRELDEATILRARIVVESRAAALEEAGELVIPLQAGAIDASHIIADLHEVVRGAGVRRSRSDITLFKSVGVAFEDLAVAAAAAENLSNGS